MDLPYFCIFGFFSFAMGACIASFLNVCIWRLPRNESVVRPASHCPNCNAPIRWFQNIPVLSYIALGGKCASCRKPISMRYTIVELLGGILFLAAYLQWAMPAAFADLPVAGMRPLFSLGCVPAFWLVFSGLILGSFIDLEHFYLPDRVTIGGMLLGVPASFLLPELQLEKNPVNALIWSAAGLSFGFFFLWAMGWMFSKLFKKDALGFGDVKLMGAVGAFFGPTAVLFVLIVSSIVGSVVGIALIIRGRAKLGGFTAVPYGPFIAVAVLVWMFWGPKLVDTYIRLLTR
jgi:leader peptidase (prepilin peptidase)/N-methyltransferase